MEPKRKKLMWNVIGIISIIILAVLLTRSHYTRSNKSFVTALQDSLVTFKDENGYQRGRIMTLQDTDTKRLLDLKSRDSSIIRLQAAVERAEKKYDLSKPGTSVVVLDTQISVDTIAPTIVVGEDTMGFPVYSSQFNLGGWVWGSTTARQDSTIHRINVRDELDIVVGYDKGTIFKRGIAFSDVTSKNPYSEIKQFRTYNTITPPPANVVIGPSFTYGIGPDFKIQPIIGVSITYGVLRFRL